MKKIFLILSTFILSTGCQNPISTPVIPSMPNAVTELQGQSITQNEKQKSTSTQPKSITQSDIILYRGSWFEIQYPKEFIATPSSGETDEAKFFLPDGSIEFFVFSPLWGGNPADYLNISSTEELVDEKTEESGDDLKKQVIRWVTLKAKDGSYYRSFISIKSQVGTGSDIHKVLGIKYKDNATYEKYKDSYVSFKKSLKQFSD